LKIQTTSFPSLSSYLKKKKNCVLVSLEQNKWQ